MVISMLFVSELACPPLNALIWVPHPLVLLHISALYISMFKMTDGSGKGEANHDTNSIENTMKHLWADSFLLIK